MHLAFPRYDQLLCQSGEKMTFSLTRIPNTRTFFFSVEESAFQ